MFQCSDRYDYGFSMNPKTLVKFKPFSHSWSLFYSQAN